MKVLTVTEVDVKGARKEADGLSNENKQKLLGLYDLVEKGEFMQAAELISSWQDNTDPVIDVIPDEIYSLITNLVFEQSWFIVPDAKLVDLLKKNDVKMHRIIWDDKKQETK